MKICLLSLKNYHTTYREKQPLWTCGQGQTQIWRWKWLEVQSLRLGRSSSCQQLRCCVGNKKCEIPFHHMLSARTLGSIYSNCDLKEPILSIPSLFALSSPSVQAGEEPKHSFSGPCSDVLPSSQSWVNYDVGREYHLLRGVCLNKSAGKWLKH